MTPKQVLEKWISHFNKGNVDALTELYSENAINHQVANEKVRGRENIRKMFEEEFSNAEMICTPENIFQDGEWAIMEWKDPKGLRGCGFFQIKNDKIVFQRGYWDQLSFLKKHNLPMPPEFK